MKKIIFVGGIRYSGSTLLDLTLANDPRGFSVGEISSFFKRYKDRPSCSCEGDPCPIWSKVLENGLPNCYKTVFKLNPNVDFIVDSSKSSIWIRKMKKLAEMQGFKTCNVLIWKNPEESAASFHKRGDLAKWTRQWIHYHRLYLSVNKDFVAINHGRFVTEPNLLQKLSAHIGIDFFEGKSEYWTKDHHNVGGNSSTKIHLFENKSKTFDELNRYMKERSNDSELASRHRSLYRSKAPEEVVDFVRRARAKNPIINDLVDAMNAKSPDRLSKDDCDFDHSKLRLYGNAYLDLRSFVSAVKLKLTGN